jgi:hypothetical protein
MVRLPVKIVIVLDVQRGSQLNSKQLLKI